MISPGRCFRGRNPGVAAHLRERMGLPLSGERRGSAGTILRSRCIQAPPVWYGWTGYCPRHVWGKMLCCIQRVLRVPNGSIREASSRADSLSSCWLELPHLGETMHEGHPASQRHSANLDAVVCHHCSARS